MGGMVVDFDEQIRKMELEQMPFYEQDYRYSSSRGCFSVLIYIITNIIIVNINIITIIITIIIIIINPTIIIINNIIICNILLSLFISSITMP